MLVLVTQFNWKQMPDALSNTFVQVIVEISSQLVHKQRQLMINEDREFTEV